MSRSVNRTQISAGGVAYREQAGRIEIAIISVGDRPRWQLPKGLIDEGESAEIAARREVREEAGIETEMLEPIDKIEYWFSTRTQDTQIRFHKFVHFFLLRYTGGDVADHDHEVNEARWVEIDHAINMLTFSGEREIARRAKTMIKL